MASAPHAWGRPDINELSQDELRQLLDRRFYAIDVTDVRGPHEMGGTQGHGYWYANDWIVEIPRTSVVGGAGLEPATSAL